VQLTGPKGTPYRGGWFDVELNFPSSFPRDMPKGRFVTRIWHPNVGSRGDICISQHRKDTGECAVECVLAALQMLLTSPNPNSLLNSECAEQFEDDHEAFVEKAAAMTRQFAMS
jgi:ubiquitin-conjugating enzyme E2 S